MLALSSAQYSQTLCSGCGEDVPKQCSQLIISEVSCEIPSSAFLCQKQEVRDGWIFCPSCPEGYSLASCGSSWLFGLFKTSHCVLNYSTACGKYCELQDSVVSRTECAIQKKKKCCEIPTNSIEIFSPYGSNLTFYRNESVDFAMLYSGAVKNISIDYGDGHTGWEAPTQSGIATSSHTYMMTGDFQAIAKAYSCENCSHKFVSTSSVNFTVRYNRV